jgi:hypothetical protein
MEISTAITFNRQHFKLSKFPKQTMQKKAYNFYTLICILFSNNLSALCNMPQAAELIQVATLGHNHKVAV